MHIEELTSKASFDFLAANRLGRLACSNQSQPYITPIHYAYHDNWIYGFSTIGQKVEWLRANPLACVQVDLVEILSSGQALLFLGAMKSYPLPMMEPRRVSSPSISCKRKRQYGGSPAMQ